MAEGKKISEMTEATLENLSESTYMPIVNEANTDDKPVGNFKMKLTTFLSLLSSALSSTVDELEATFNQALVGYLKTEEVKSYSGSSVQIPSAKWNGLYKVTFSGSNPSLDAYIMNMSSDLSTSNHTITIRYICTTSGARPTFTLRNPSGTEMRWVGGSVPDFGDCGEISITYIGSTYLCTGTSFARP